MKHYVIIVQGGAGPDSEFIKQNKKGYEEGLAEAIKAGCSFLEKGGTAVDAVEAAVKSLENNPLFNSGKGSALNTKGEVQMDASIMDGLTLNSGAVSLVQNVKNPVSLAKSIMQKTKYRFLGNHGALEYAREINCDLESDAYFFTPHQYEEFIKTKKENNGNNTQQKYYGTVGAVALDIHGNLAAATSTGGSPAGKEGRISDSCIIGSGCYANNNCCAVSCTGDGEFIMKAVVATSIRCAMQYKNLKVQEACDFIVNQENNHIKADIGVIAIDCEGNIGITFNSERMHRGYSFNGKPPVIEIYGK